MQVVFCLIDVDAPIIKKYILNVKKIETNSCVHPIIFCSHTKFHEKKHFCGLCKMSEKMSRIVMLEHAYYLFYATHKNVPFAQYFLSEHKIS
jgi:hypothetical protein